MLAIRTILHPTDFSEFSEQAFLIACSLARDYHARLVVLHVVEPPIPLMGEGVLLPPIPVDVEGESQRLRNVVPTDPSINVEHIQVEGEPAREIVDVALQTKCDVIVMGTHGRSGLKRLVMGSIADEVIRSAPCPVLTAKPTKPKKLPAHKPANTEARVPVEQHKV